MNIEALGELTSKSIIPSWFKRLVEAIAMIAIVVTIYAHGEKQHARGLEAGTNACKAVCQANSNTALIAANAEIIRLQKQANDDEALHQQRIAKIVDYLQELQTHEKAKSDAVIRDLAAGNVKLQFRLAAASPSQTSADSTSAARARPVSSDEETTGELPPEIAADLYAEADRADEVTEQLNACQQVVIEDRRVCGVVEGAVK